MLYSGRGGAKSFHVADFLLKLSYEPGHTILYTRWTMVSAILSIIPEFIDKITRYGLEDVFEITQNQITNKATGVTIIFRGIRTSQGTNTAALKSISGVTTLVIEELEDVPTEDIFDTIDLSIRHLTLQNRIIGILNPTFKGHWVYKRFFSRLPKENFNGTFDGCTYIYTSYLTNRENLAASFIEQANRVKAQNVLRYKHLFLGSWLDDADGLLWNRAMIERQRIDKAPPLTRVVVAIDPAGTATATSDETGIVVVGLAGEHGYVIEDLSGKYSPLQWATIAVNAAKSHGASAIVAEKNQGHDMVEAVIRQVDKTIRVKLVTATKGKAVRAEPIYSMYEQGRVWHVGQHPVLELQMVTFNPEENADSPDRVDALVWGLTDLMLKPAREWFAV
jgi:PBSX family phage terminase large subunit